MSWGNAFGLWDAGKQILHLLPKVDMEWYGFKNNLQI
jgi:hypothetical protein